ncbi:hypothetical protein AMAG_11061 [Allomyces macrogynus ATCC 38327]|uniref:U2 small nuclear ribonucleoprotein A' n=1 Tax=Allomyces macrogynus (strain ATCC 38327) TaxID=578462 RepID=A0A0L0SSA1_ALLM3|nr:hypothetical protein AMAG_11061 [Allomyces macrogynus ATCC 38327]|eukprot:KNE65433.1 hypothetical protein AMAG_11061 [Allomyces macrogynus ATCC 38327]
MVKLTADLISHTDTFLNALGERELDLRGLRIPAIENLGAARDTLDTLNLTDNDVRSVSGFPRMPRMTALMLAHNRVTRIDPDAGSALPNLHTLILSHNQVAELGDLDALTAFPSLVRLSLVGNPVSRKPNYRLYAIHRAPSVRVLDFAKVRDVERKAARDLFVNAKTGKDSALAAEYTASRSTGAAAAAEDEEMDTDAAQPALPAGPSLAPEDIAKIKEAIKKAKSMAEIHRLEEMLSRGKIPDDARLGDQMDEDEDE